MDRQGVPWVESVQVRLLGALPKVWPGLSGWAVEFMDRAEAGRKTYGSYLGVGNPGRDADQDLQEELLDAMVYAYERHLATNDSRYWAAVLRLAYTLDDLYPDGKP
jgi:hypothetical protein